jgi:hypothetical protein
VTQAGNEPASDVVLAYVHSKQEPHTHSAPCVNPKPQTLVEWIVGWWLEVYSCTHLMGCPGSMSASDLMCSRSSPSGFNHLQNGGGGGTRGGGVGRDECVAALSTCEWGCG